MIPVWDFLQRQKQFATRANEPEPYLRIAALVLFICQSMVLLSMLVTIFAGG
jgi:hypothetical protein